MDETSDTARKVTVYFSTENLPILEEVRKLAVVNDRKISTMIRRIVTDWLDRLESEKGKK